jgi:hypothetical protein
MAAKDRAAGTREWLDTNDVRHDLEAIFGQLSARQLRLVRRLSEPGRHPVGRADLDEIKAVNWLAEAFWFKRPLLELDGDGASVAEQARGVVRTLLDSRTGPGWRRRALAAGRTEQVRGPVRVAVTS